MKQTTKNYLLIGGLVISFCLNATQFLVFKSAENSVDTAEVNQTVEQEKSILEGKLKEREKRINELQAQLAEKDEVPEGEATGFEQTYAKQSIAFSKLALSGQTGAVNYAEELKPLVTEELYNRMIQSAEEKTETDAIQLEFTGESAFIDVSTMTTNKATVFVKLVYRYANGSNNAAKEQPETNAYLKLTLVKDTTGQSRISNFEMG
ncbi:hypothetical protein AAFB08_002624 [Enterococcus faecalis]